MIARVTARATNEETMPVAATGSQRGSEDDPMGNGP